MRKIVFYLVALLCLVSCSDDIVASGDVTIDENQEQIEASMQTIRISAAPGESRGNRTSLDGENFNITWDQGDEFRLVNPQVEGVSTTLQMTVNGQQAYGIKISSSGTALVKYSYINVTIDGVDKTEEFTSAGDDNAYKLGINNSGKYKYAPAGTPVTAEIKKCTTGNAYAIPLVRVGGDSPIITNKNTVVITLKDIEYSTNSGSSWTKVDANSTFNNGGKFNVSGVKDVASIAWPKGMNVNMVLESEPGLPHGDFVGKTSFVDVIDENTMTVYPSNVLQGYINGNISLALPEVQTYAEESFGHGANVMLSNVMTDANGSYHVAFKNMCGVLQLKFKGQGEVGSISITDKSGKMLWGNVSVAASDYQDGISTEMLTGGDNTITLNCEGVTLADEEKTFHVVVPVGAFENGMDIEVKSKDGQKMYKKSTTANNMIKRGIVKQMPALTVEMIASYTLENEAVEKYFSYGPYANYGDRSYFTTYSSALKNYYDHDDPLSVPITWTGDASKTYTVTLTYKNDEGVSTSKTYTTTGTSYNAYNLVPGKKYSYTVKDGDNTVATSGFYTTGHVRMVTIDDSWNYRDIGGWTGLNGKKIKYEWIYRGGSLNGKFYKEPKYSILSSANEYGIIEQTDPSHYTFGQTSQREVLDLGIKSELDLRTTRQEENNDNAKDKSHAWSLGQNNTGISDWNFFHIKTSGASEPLANYSVIKDVAWIINEVVNKKRPVAFHCKSGADRTGMVGIALEALLGVAPGDLARDYELTNFSSEQGVVVAKHELRDRKADDSSKEAYKFHKAIFKDDTSNKGTNYQEKMYYYLNQAFKAQGVAINASDLDKFIKFMLGLDSYTHPSWATENGNSLESIYNHQ